MTLLNKQEQEQVAAAISAVERETDAEMVTVLTAKADNYAYIPLLWAGLIALIIPGAINYFAAWLTVDTLLLSQWAVFIVLSLLFRIPAINMRLVPRSVRYWRASNLARRQFLEQNLHHTAGQTGMLIFVSEAERYVEILVDQGISSKINNDVWADIISTFAKQVKQGNTLEGFLTCIEACGAHLKTTVPATGEKNELPNHLVILS